LKKCEFAQRKSTTNKPSISSLATLLNLLLGSVLDSWGLGSSSSLWLFCYSLLSLDLLQVSIFDILLGGLNSLISGGSILASLSLNILETHANNSLLNSSRLSSFLSLDLFNFDFLVLSSPCLGPGELDWLDILVVKRSNFRVHKILRFSVLTSELGASTRPDFHLGVGARISLNNHLSESK